MILVPPKGRLLVDMMTRTSWVAIAAVVVSLVLSIAAGLLQEMRA